MSIYKDAAGRLHVAVQIHGRRLHRRCPRGATKAEAQALEAQWRRQLWLGELGAGADPGLPAAIEEYLKVCRQKSIAKTAGHAYQLADWVRGKRVADAPAVAEDYIAFHRRRLAADTINHRLAILKGACKLAWRREWIKEPLWVRIPRLPVANRREVYLTQAQIEALAAASDAIGADAILIAGYTGMRLSELCALRREDYRDGALWVGDSKNGRPRAVPVIERIADACARLPLPVGHRALQVRFEAARAAVGVPWATFHTLRHSCASMLVQRGVDLYTVGRILGHSSPAITQRYAHLAVDGLRSKMAVLDCASPATPPSTNPQAKQRPTRKCSGHFSR
jgi:integrase